MSKIKSFQEYLGENVLEHTWDGVSTADVNTYVKLNGLKLVKDTKNKDMFIATKNGKFIFRYDPEELALISDYTIFQLSGGKIK